MRQGLLIVASTTLFLCGCAQHDKAWDDAFAQCQAEAIEKMETEHVARDQRASWQDTYIDLCMQKKGVSS